MTDGIIFDLDGTLWDSCRSVAESWQQTLREHYKPDAVVTASDIAGIMGMTPAQITAALFSEYGDSAEEIAQRCMREECEYITVHGGRLYDDMEEVLKTLSREHSLFIVSNCQLGYIQSFLAFTGFSKYFTDFIEQASTGLSKGENNRLIIERHSLKSPVYIGDTASDKASAEFAGIPFIYAAYGFGRLEGEALTVSAPSEIPGVIASL